MFCKFLSCRECDVTLILIDVDLDLGSTNYRRAGPNIPVITLLFLVGLLIIHFMLLFYVFNKTFVKRLKWSNSIKPLSFCFYIQKKIKKKLKIFMVFKDLFCNNKSQKARSAKKLPNALFLGSHFW